MSIWGEIFLFYLLYIFVDILITLALIIILIICMAIWAPYLLLKLLMMLLYGVAIVAAFLLGLYTFVFAVETAYKTIIG